MSKYIEADELKESLDEARLGWQELNDDRADELASVIKAIDEMPGVDVAEVKHGEWERIESDTSVDFQCSACHRYSFHNWKMLRRYKFCPNCGADMRGETK